MRDPHDERGVPISTGIPPIVIISALICIVVIFVMLTLVFRNSAFGHAWPWTNAATGPL
jgi:hypothetical protein